MKVLYRTTESEERALTSPIDMTELLGRLNDREEQAMAYPAVDDYEENIDLVATDILHGWRDSEAYTEQAMFADAFANAFRVVVLSDGQQVLRRTGLYGDRWVWEHTGHIAGWTVASYCGDGPADQPDAESERLASYFGAGRERWFATAADAVDRARESVSVAGEHCRKTCVVVRGIEVYSGDEMPQTAGEVTVPPRADSAGSERR